MTFEDSNVLDTIKSFKFRDWGFLITILIAVIGVTSYLDSDPELKADIVHLRLSLNAAEDLENNLNGDIQELEDELAISTAKHAKLRGINNNLKEMLHEHTEIQAESARLKIARALDQKIVIQSTTEIGEARNANIELVKQLNEASETILELQEANAAVSDTRYTAPHFTPARKNELYTLLQTSIDKFERERGFDGELHPSKVWYNSHGNRAVSVSIGADELFKNNSYNISEAGQLFLAQFATLFTRQSDVDLIIEGHSDSRPVSDATKRVIGSNWTVSALRAASVADFFINGAEIDVAKVNYFGCENKVPATKLMFENDANKSNRRITLLITPAQSVN